MRELSHRPLPRASLVALAFVALVSAASHVALDRILKAQDGPATGLALELPRFAAGDPVPHLPAVSPDAGRAVPVAASHPRLTETQRGILRWLASATLAVVLLTLLCEALLILRPMLARLARYLRALAAMASTDPLTQVANRRSLTDRADALIRRAHAGQRPLSVLMIDVDRVKAVNAAHGRASGDTVLQALCRTLASRLKPAELLGRLGGAAFCVVLPDTPLGGAAVVAEQLRQAVAGLAVPVDPGAIAFTISIGLAELSASDPGFQAPLDRAERAVHQAKSAGRNRVVAAPMRVAGAEAGFDGLLRLSA